MTPDETERRRLAVISKQKQRKEHAKQGKSFDEIQDRITDKYEEVKE